MTLNVQGTQIVSNTSVITNAPNLTASGTITATSFVGNGSALTGISGGGSLISGTNQSVTASTSTTTINTANGGQIDLTLSANTVLTIINSLAVTELYIKILGSGYSIVWPTNVKWDGGPGYTPDTYNNNVNLVSLYTANGGTTWDARIREATLNYNYTTEYRTAGRMYFAGGTDWAGQNTTNSFIYPDNILRSSLTAIGSGTNWLDVRVNGNTYIYNVWAIRNDYTLWNWGSPCTQGTGYSGALYTSGSPYPYSSSPVQVGTDTDWWKFGQFGQSAPDVVIKKDGSAWWWTDRLRGDPSMFTLGSQRFSPTQVFGGQWKAIGMAGKNSTLSACVGIKADGSLWTWGNNYNKGIIFSGLGSESADIPILSPIQYGVEKDWADVQCGGYFYFLLKNDGRAFVTGRNDLAGILGDGSTPVTLSSLTQVAGGAKWKQLCAGPYMWAGIQNDNSLWVCGQGNGAGAWSGIPPAGVFRSSITQIAGSWNQVMLYSNGNSGAMYAIKSDGTLWGSGTQDAGQLGNSTTANISSLTQISSNTGWVRLIPSGGYSGNPMGGIRLT